MIPQAQQHDLEQEYIQYLLDRMFEYSVIRPSQVWFPPNAIDTICKSPQAQEWIAKRKEELDNG